MKVEPIDKLLFCDRGRFKLLLYERQEDSYKFQCTKRYGVAIGMQGHLTPDGLYLINTKAKDPEWLMPDEEWVREDLRGTIIPGGDPANPLKARWLGVTDPAEGVGIHGTAVDASIGFAQSHGCIRMHVPDVIELFDLVPKYTPIYIT